MTDEASQYTKVGREFSEHGMGEYVRGDVHTDTIEGYFSILKRGLVGTFHHVSPAHLKRYVGEFDFRYNYPSRLGYTDRQRPEVLVMSVGGRRLMYRDSSIG